MADRMTLMYKFDGEWYPVTVTIANQIPSVLNKEGEKVMSLTSFLRTTKAMEKLER